MPLGSHGSLCPPVIESIVDGDLHAWADERCLPRPRPGGPASAPDASRTVVMPSASVPSQVLDHAEERQRERFLHAGVLVEVLVAEREMDVAIEQAGQHRVARAFHGVVAVEAATHLDDPAVLDHDVGFAHESAWRPVPSNTLAPRNSVLLTGSLPRDRDLDSRPRPYRARTDRGANRGHPTRHRRRGAATQGARVHRRRADPARGRVRGARRAHAREPRGSASAPCSTPGSTRSTIRSTTAARASTLSSRCWSRSSGATPRARCGTSRGVRRSRCNVHRRTEGALPATRRSEVNGVTPTRSPRKAPAPTSRWWRPWPAVTATAGCSTARSGT